MTEVVELKEDDVKVINKKLIESLENYRQTIQFMCGDAPIETLCLKKTTLTPLLAHGCLRIYDLFNMDFTKIEGLGDRGIGDLTSRLNEFLSMC